MISDDNYSRRNNQINNGGDSVGWTSVQAPNNNFTTKTTTSSPSIQPIVPLPVSIQSTTLKQVSPILQFNKEKLGDTTLSLEGTHVSPSAFKNNNNNQQLQQPAKDDLLGVYSMKGYCNSLLGEVLYWMLAISTCGLIFLVYHWFNLLEIRVRYRPTRLIDSATIVVVYGIDQRYEICQVVKLQSKTKYIVFRHSRFFYDPQPDLFIKPTIRIDYRLSELNQLINNGSSNATYLENFNIFGKNVIQFPIKNIPRLLLEEVLHPFFIFQIYSVALWMAEEYYYYACAIFAIATTSSILSLREIRQNLISLRNMSTYSCNVSVLRDGSFATVSSNDLVPGDIVDIHQNLVLPCDLALLTGQAICNESMLTGESIPVTKHPLINLDELNQFKNIKGGIADDRIIDITQSRSSMFGGTVVVKTIVTPNQRVLGMVKEIGFQTSKGRLILSILFPKKSHFKFLSESLKFVGVLCCIAMFGFAVSVYRLHSLGETPKTIVLRALDLITIVIPPALPMAMTVGTGFALVRLKKKRIFCISPPRLNMAGKIQVFCFDKTGTLTEEGLDFLGVHAVNMNNSSTGNNRCTFNEAMTSQISQLQSNQMLLRMAMATCHSLSTINNEISGDPLEIKIFHATKSDLVESQGEQAMISIPSTPFMPQQQAIYFERFDFQSQLQRMSVIVNVTDGLNGQPPARYAFIKGSPEMMKRLSVSETIPSNYDQQLSKYTEKGYRVLAIAYKVWNNPTAISNKEQLRTIIEDQVRFLGFVVMENKLKPESKDTISTLHRANIKTIMVTGDNPLTAVSVAKQCGILKPETLLYMPEIVESNSHIDSAIVWNSISSNIDNDNNTGSFHKLDPNTLLLEGEEHNSYSLIITGPVFKKIYSNYLLTGSNRFIQMLKRGLVYSRMSPDEKQTLVEELQRIGLYVGMCGDGANDCGALKSAHVGISLSESEASIAAPFTSTVTNITCCPELIMEGRASLAVSFKLFQFMGMYSLIQFTSVILLYFIASVLGNWMYLYQDLWIIFPLVIFMGMTRPSSKLSIKRPSGRLISGAVVGSLIVHVLVCISFQLGIFFLLRSKSWYNEEQIDEDNIMTYVTTSLFTYGNFQYLIMALAFSFGKPFLKPLYTNRPLFVVYITTLITSFLILFLPTEKVWEFGQLLVMPVSWRLTMFGLMMANLGCNIFIEFCFIYYKLRSKKKKMFNYNQIFSKSAPKDNRITEESILLPINSK